MSHSKSWRRGLVATLSLVACFGMSSVASAAVTQSDLYVEDNDLIFNEGWDHATELYLQYWNLGTEVRVYVQPDQNAQYVDAANRCEFVGTEFGSGDLFPGSTDTARYKCTAERRFEKVDVEMLNGPDKIVVIGDLNASVQQSHLEGGEDDDIIVGTLGFDEIEGGEGSDNLDGGGNTGTWDEIDGNDGHDTITGGNGFDLIEGGDDNDEIASGAFFDVVDGGEGDDKVDLGDGHDLAFGGRGSDTINGDSGGDCIYGGNVQDDTAGDGPSGENRCGTSILGSLDDNIPFSQVNGRYDHDTLSGGSGEDDIYGDAGRDRIYGNDGDDDLFGEGPEVEEGDDECEGDQEGGPDDEDQCDDDLYGGNGVDEVYGDYGDDQVYGNAGNDWLFGDFDPTEDDREGTEGGTEDGIYGGSGNDHLYGGEGENIFRAEEGDDHLFATDTGSVELVDCGSGYDYVTYSNDDDADSCEVFTIL